MAVLVPVLPCDELMAHLRSHLHEDKDGDMGPFAAVLDLDVSHVDARATFEGVRVNCVDVDGDSITISYSVDYNVFSGCKDLNESDCLDLDVRGHREGRQWVFSEHQSPPRRTTLDEF